MDRAQVDPVLRLLPLPPPAAGIDEIAVPMFCRWLGGLGKV